MFWKPKRLNCHIYENGICLNLSQCSYTEVVSLVNSIDQIWKHPPQADVWDTLNEQANVWYTVDLEETNYFFYKSSPMIKVSCFTLHPRSWSGKKRLSITKVKHGRPIGKAIRIYPKNTLTHSWSGTIEVVFTEEK